MIFFLLFFFSFFRFFAPPKHGAEASRNDCVQAKYLPARVTAATVFTIKRLKRAIVACARAPHVSRAELNLFFFVFFFWWY